MKKHTKKRGPQPKGAEPLRAFRYHGQRDAAFYLVADAPDVLVRMGLCRIDEQGKVQASSLSYAMLSRRKDGIIGVRAPVNHMLRADGRFRAAIERCLNGDPLTDFRLPPPVRRPRRPTDDQGEPA